jgi:hypothetical protein
LRIRDVAALTAIPLLCLPGLGGGVALLVNTLTGRPADHWGVVSSVAVVIASMFGIPLLLMAIVVCAFVLFSIGVSPKAKLANVILLGLSIAATFSVSFRFPF